MRAPHLSSLMTMIYGFSDWFVCLDSDWSDYFISELIWFKYIYKLYVIIPSTATRRMICLPRHMPLGPPSSLKKQ